MDKAIPTSRVLPGSTQLLLMMMTLSTVARVADSNQLMVNVTISANSSTVMTVSWQSPTTSIDYYVVYLNETNNATAMKSFNISSTITTQAFTDLVPGRSYRASVTACSGNNSQPSGVVTDRTLPPTVNVTIMANSSTIMTISWQAPLSDIDYYSVYLIETNNVTAKKSFNLSSTVTTKVFTDLVPGRSYNASVTAYSGMNSQTSAIVIGRTFPPKPTVTLTSMTIIWITVVWTVPESDVDYYRLFVKAPREPESEYSWPGTKEIMLCNPTVISGKKYNLIIQANSGLYSQRSDPLTIQLLPTSTNATITAKTMTTMTVSFVTSLPEAYFYVVYLNETANGNLVNTSVIYSTTSTFIGLVPGRSYSVFLVAFSRFASQTSDVVVDRTLPPTVNVTIMANSSTIMMISWQAPLSDIDYYSVYLIETNNVTAKKSFNLSSTVTTKVFTDLVPGRSYNASVTAYSGMNSQTSAIVIGRTLSPKPTVTLTSMTIICITVVWTVPESDVDYYRLFVKAPGEPEDEYSWPGTKEIMLCNPTVISGKKYNLTIQANSGLYSQRSDPLTIQLLPTSTNVTITAKTMTTMTVSFVTSLPEANYYVVYLNETENGNLVNSSGIYSTTTTFYGLVPGRSYSVSLEAFSRFASQTSDVVVDRTYPAPVDTFECIMHSSDDIFCSWSLPSGVWSELFLQVIKGDTLLQTVNISNDAPFFITKYPVGETIIETQGYGKTNSTFTMFGQLQANTQYNVNITTLSGDLKSQTLQSTAKTDIRAPPPVSELVSITTVQNLVTSSVLAVYFNCSWFQSTNGDLVYYTVIVNPSEGTSYERPAQLWPMGKYADYTSGSVNVYQVDDRPYPSGCSDPNSIVKVRIGTGGSRGDFYDGPLNKSTAYRISFRVYTYLPNTSYIRRSGGEALYTDTFFSLPLRTLMNNSVNIGSIVGAVVGGLLGILAITIAGTLLYQRRERVREVTLPDLPHGPTELNQGAEPILDPDCVNTGNIYTDLDYSYAQENGLTDSSPNMGEDATPIDIPDYINSIPDNVYADVDGPTKSPILHISLSRINS